MGRVLMNFKGIRPVLAVMAVLTLIQTIAIIMQARWLAEVVSALFAGAKIEEQFGTAGLFLLAFAIRQLCVLLQQRTASHFADRTSKDLRKKVLDKLFQLGPRYAGVAGTGNLVTLVIEGVIKFRNYLELFLPRMLATGMTPVLILAYVYTLDVTSGVILTLTLPILIVFMILIGLTSKKRMDQQWESYRTLSNHFVDSLRGLETLKFLGRSKRHSASIKTVSDSYRVATVKTLRVAFLSSFALDFFTMLSVATVAVNLGLPLIEGNMSLLPALTILILAPEYFLPVRMVGADYHATLDGKDAGEAMNRIIDAAEAREARHVPLPTNVNLNWKQDSKLVLHNIGLTHEQGHTPSVSDVSLEIAGLRKIGIVGESGAGKSTLIDMLGGFLSPTSGEFNMGGTAIRDLMHSDWRNQITYIPQSPYIFSGTLSQNIAFYTPEATDQEIEAAALAAGLGSLVRSLPNGYNEPIGGGGRSLSGGQEQRVALARALLTGRPIILLDEPTAHLDIETEYELKETMLPLFKDRLVILATHRLHWMQDMDEIIVMEQGKVVEQGTHEELTALQGSYYGMLHLQQEGL